MICLLSIIFVRVHFFASDHKLPKALCRLYSWVKLVGPKYAKHYALCLNMQNIFLNVLCILSSSAFIFFIDNFQAFQFFCTFNFSNFVNIRILVSLKSNLNCAISGAPWSGLILFFWITVIYVILVFIPFPLMDHNNLRRTISMEPS